MVRRTANDIDNRSQTSPFVATAATFISSSDSAKFILHLPTKRAPLLLEPLSNNNATQGPPWIGDRIFVSTKDESRIFFRRIYREIVIFRLSFKRKISLIFNLLLNLFILNILNLLYLLNWFNSVSFNSSLKNK